MLPEAIEITDHLAASLLFETWPAPHHDEIDYLELDADVKAIDDGELRRDLTARDRSLLMIVAWWSANMPNCIDGDSIRVPDRPLRQALGMRTLRDSWEDHRLDRWARSVMKSDIFPDLDEGAPVPTMTKGMRRRTVSGNNLWDVDDRIRTAFEVSPGDTVVEIAWEILRGAKSRYTLTLLMRLLAWGTGYHPSKWLAAKRPDHRLLRIRDDEFREALGIGADVKAADVWRKIIKPALNEIHVLTRLPIDLEPWYGPSIKRGGRGRLMGYSVIAPENGRTIPEPAPASPPAEVVVLHDKPFGRPDPSLDAEDEDLGF